MKTKFFFLLVFISTFSFAGRAQVITNYSDADGLADNYVNGGVAIGADGTKWFGTANGLSKFDNSQWTTYTTAHGLVSNYINCVTIDQSGNVWIGTDNGVSKFDGTNWSTFTTTQGLIDNAVYSVFCASNGDLWFGTYSGVSKFNGTTWTNYGTSQGLSSISITCFAENSNNDIWIGTLGGGVNIFNGTTFSLLNSTLNGLPNDNVFSIAFDSNGLAFVGTWYGVSKLNSGNTVDTTYVYPQLYNNFVRDIVFDGDGNMWTGVFADYNLDGGVTRFDGSNWNSMSTPMGLADMQVKQLAVDADNNIWVATGNGVSKIQYHVSLNDIESQNINLFPNPCSNFLKIEGDYTLASVKVLDVLGNLVINSKLTDDNVVNVQELKEGVYFIIIESADFSATKRFVVSR